MKPLFVAIAFLLAAAGTAVAAPVDEVAAVLADAGRKPLTVESLPVTFARLVHFKRSDANGMVLFTEEAPADGHVRQAQAQFDTVGAARPAAEKMPVFSVALELVDQPDFSFNGLAAAMEHQLGTPTASSNQAGATFRTWLLKDPQGRSITLARAPGSDNGDTAIIYQLVQNR
ncbi:MAG TPA: hypothetical protein VKZ79_03930 [Alphaproteobacteria bacterium]|nr:hypothetical protein [Alphaproteobacteria bacterium]